MTARPLRHSTATAAERSGEQAAIASTASEEVPAKTGGTIAKDRLDALTSLRFFAAMMIVVAHCGGVFGFRGSNWSLAQAVSFFFVLSGFVLMYRYPAFRSGRDVLQFYRNRVARIWPVYLLALVLVLIFDPRMRAAFGPVTLLANVLLVHQWIQFAPGARDLHFGIHSAAWTLSTLAALYLIFPLWSRSFEKTWRWKLPASLGLAVVMMWACKHTALRDAYFALGSYNINRWIYQHFSVRLYEFTLGMSAAIAFHRVRERQQLSKTLATSLEIAAVVLAVAFATVVSGALLDWSTAQRWLGPTVATWVGQGSVSAAAFALLVLVFALQRGKLSHWLKTPTLVTLGELSFAVYLLSGLFLRYYRLREKAFPPLPDAILFMIFLAMVLLAAHVTWGWIEQPARARYRLTRAQRKAGLSNRFSVVGFDLSSPAYRNLSPAALELALRPTRPIWGSFSRPGHAWLGVEAGCLLLLIVGWVAMAHARSNVNLISDPKDLAASLNGARPDLQNVTFGDAFELLGIETKPTVGGLQVRMIWKSLKDQPLDYTVVVHLISERNTEPLARSSYPQDMSKGQIAKGAVWQERITIPREKLTNARMLGVGLRHTKDALIAKSKSTDLGGYRLLLSLPERETVAR